MEVVEQLAVGKALAVSRAHAGEECLVLGSDTVVVVGEGDQERLLGKPAGADEAREMLELLSGTRHRVLTGVAVVQAASGQVAVDHECTRVTMREISASEVQDYVASLEWMDKAGGYAIQETADRFVTRLEGGGFDNVVGLPVALTLDLLAAAGLVTPGG